MFKDTRILTLKYNIYLTNSINLERENGENSLIKGNIYWTRHKMSRN